MRHDEMGATEAMRTDMERARRLRRVAATFREWLEAEARRGERIAGLGTKKAEDALATCDGARKDGWEVVLEAFRGYSAAAKEVCMGGPNLAEHTFEEGRVRTREADWQRRTLYLGGKDKTATGEEDGEKVQGTPGLEASKAWEEEIPEDNKVTWEDARRRLPRRRNHQ